MGAISCFLLEPTGQLWRALRRYAGSGCPENGGAFHGAMAFLDVVPDTLTDERGILRTTGLTWPLQDPRWPTECGCGQPFEEGAEHQLFVERLYRRTDTGETFPLREAPVGAIYRAPWYEDRTGWVGPDGKSYVCVTPAGPWAIDGPSTDRPHGWTRTGEPPRFTVTPSIGKHHADGSWAYHGWLRDGQLIDA